MKILSAVAVVSALAAATPLAARTQDDGLDPAKAAAFDERVFAGPVGQKVFACFVRRYDTRHLVQHPKQKVAAMKLLVTAEKAPGEPTAHAFHVGVQFRDRPGNFDGGSSCSHMVSEDSGLEITFSCGVECGDGGLEIALSKDDKSAIVRLAAIAIWNRKTPDGDTESLQGGADDKVFRVDHVDDKECAELPTNREELASLRQK